MKKLIELDAAVSALDGLPMDYGRWDVDDVLHALASVPTVDAVPVIHGRWIYHPDWQADGECGYECSECGMGSEVDYPYCMRCGAKMDGKDGDNHDG